MIAQGFELMIVGMAVVFLFLAALVTTLHISAFVFSRISPGGDSDAAMVTRAIAIAAAYDRDSRRAQTDA